MLSDRRQRVLTALIEEYVARALPVGSRTLAERYHLGVSPATVRNDLSALEDAGYITQPHTSAGRVPTDAGYRAFVDDLLASEAIEDDPTQQDIVDEIRATARELDELIEQTSAMLTRLTDCLSVVVAPSVTAAPIRQLSLISLNNYRVLIVIVAEDGQVINRHLDFAHEVTLRDLERAERLLNQVLTGKTFMEIKGSDATCDTEELNDPLASIILEEALTALEEGQQRRAHRGGVSALLRKPEFSRAQSLLPILEVLEDRTVLMHVFDDARSANEFMVRIGRENSAEELAGVSVVAGQYGWGKGAGIVAVIGPTRMDYSRVIRAVRTARQALQGD